MAFLKWEDYAIFLITLAASLGIGLYYSLGKSKQTTTKGFILGDGNMAIFPVALSLMVTYESGLMMMGVPAEVYMYGMQWFIFVIAGFIARMLSLYMLIPSLKKLNVISMNQYFELRYNSHGLRLFSTIIRLLSLANYVGSVVFVPAVTLEIVAGIPLWISIITLMGVVVIYTMVGGFTAVVWTDVFQSVLMFGGMVAILIKGTIEAGGVVNTWIIIEEKGRFNMLDFDPDPTLRQSFWSLFVGGLISGFSWSFTQATYQRIKATPTVSTARRMFLISALLSLFISGLAVMAGAVTFAYYEVMGCDPMESKQIRNLNQLMAKMVKDIFHDTSCLPGLFLASLFSASLSTMSSLLSSMSAIFWEDIVKPHAKPMSERNGIYVTQLSVLLFGGLALLIAFGISDLEGPILRILEITGSCFVGAITGLFVLGWLIPRANALGGLIGGLVSVLFVGWISFGKLISSGVRVSPKLEPASTWNCPSLNVSQLTNTTMNYTNQLVMNGTEMTTDANPTHSPHEPQGLDILYSLSYKWLTPIAIILVLSLGSLFSRLQARKPIDPSLVVPVCDYLCRCLPESFKRKMRCGVKYSESENDPAESALTEEVMVDLIPVPGTT